MLSVLEYIGIDYNEVTDKFEEATIGKRTIDFYYDPIIGTKEVRIDIYDKKNVTEDVPAVRIYTEYGNVYIALYKWPVWKKRYNTFLAQYYSHFAVQQEDTPETEKEPEN